MIYNWKKNTPAHKLITKINKNTFENIDRQYQHLALEYSENAEEFIKQCMNNGFITYSNLRRCLRNLDTVSYIDVLPRNNRGIYGTVTNGIVFVNPDLSANRRKLYEFHELAHQLIQTELPSSELVMYNRSRTQRGKTPLNGMNIKNGWFLLEEAIVQNIAEECFYSSLGIQRPQQTHKKEPQVLGNKFFKTNFDYYGIYQPLTTMFARTLRGVGQSKTDSDDLILNEFSKKACNENFIQSVTQEYSNDVGKDTLMELLEKIGRIFNEKSVTFSNSIEGKQMSIPQTQELWNNIMAELRQLEDYRPAIINPNIIHNVGGDNR